MTREEIEDIAGWSFMYVYAKEVRFSKGYNEIIYYRLDLSDKDNKIKISQITMSDRTEKVLFDGECENIATLQLLTKLLKIR